MWGKRAGINYPQMIDSDSRGGGGGNGNANGTAAAAARRRVISNFNDAPSDDGVSVIVQQFMVLEQGRGSRGYVITEQL